MGSEYAEWLRLLAQAVHGPLTLPPCVRGQAYNPPLEIEGNLTSANIRGEVKASYDSASVLATFTFTGRETFTDGGITLTRFTGFGLSSSATASFPATPEGAGAFVYDILIDDQRFVGGLLPISGFVTGAA